MWSPTHAHVIVQRAENLLIKGKNGTNNAFVVIELGKESYRTSVKERSGKSVTWNEECELKIPKSGNTSFITLTALHRNSLGLDQFLGTVKISLASINKLEKCSEWFRLEGKPGKEKNKCRGNLEVEIDFVTKAQSQSLTALHLNRKSIERLTGSLIGLRHGDKNKSVKKFTNTLEKVVSKKKKNGADKMPESNNKHVNITLIPSINCDNFDPGVISDEEDNNSQKSSESLSALRDNETSPKMNPPNPTKELTISHLKSPEISISNCEGNIHFCSDFDIRRDTISYSGSRKGSPQLKNGLPEKRLSSSCVDFYDLSSPKPEKKFSSSLYLELNQVESNKKLSKLAKKLKHFHHVDKREFKRMVIGSESNPKSEEGLISQKLGDYRSKNKEELIRMVVDLQKRVNCVSIRVKDLEDYLDDILLKVMETVPKILEKS